MSSRRVVLMVNSWFPAVSSVCFVAQSAACNTVRKTLQRSDPADEQAPLRLIKTSNSISRRGKSRKEIRKNYQIHSLFFSLLFALGFQTISNTVTVVVVVAAAAAAAADTMNQRERHGIFYEFVSFCHNCMFTDIKFLRVHSVSIFCTIN